MTWVFITFRFNMELGELSVSLTYLGIAIKE
jgi:hypothetical protein